MCRDLTVWRVIVIQQSKIVTTEEEISTLFRYNIDFSCCKTLSATGAGNQ